MPKMSLPYHRPLRIDHGAVVRNAEGFLKFRQIHQGPVDAPDRGRMRVDEDEPVGFFRAGVLGPDVRETQKE